MKLTVKTTTGLAQRIVTWMVKHQAVAAVSVLLGATSAAIAIVIVGPSQPGGAELADHSTSMNAASNAPARPLFPVRAALPSPKDYVAVYEPANPGLYVPSRRGSRATGTLPTMAVRYSGWHQGFKTTFVAGTRTAGAVPFVQIEPRDANLAAIARGADDSYLRAYADAVAAYHGAVVIGFGQQMNEHEFSWGYLRTNATVFVQAWRHIIDIFRAQNADNVTWIWTIGKSNTTAPPLRDWWPGAGYVTWVGVEGYYDSPASAFAGTIARVRHITEDPVLLFGDSAL